MAEQKRQPGPLETSPEINVKHGTQALQGSCHDCAQGIIAPVMEGFEYWNEDGDGIGFWFCRYCGSNHVCITRDDGVVVEQGDLY
jgi:hypothetical protein